MRFSTSDLNVTIHIMTTLIYKLLNIPRIVLSKTLTLHEINEIFNGDLNMVIHIMMILTNVR